jgi:hypothetical protein
VQMMSMKCALQVSHDVCDAQVLQVRTWAEFAQEEVWAWGIDQQFRNLYKQLTRAYRVWYRPFSL